MRSAKEKLRVVSLAPNATSILCALRARGSLVGVTRWCPSVANIGRLPKFGDCWKLEAIPKILALRPDLVIGSVPFKTETVGKLLEHPVRFLALNPRTLHDIESDILLLGNLVERAARARRVVAQMRERFATILSASKRRRRLRVYCEAWPKPRISSPPWVAELVALCNAEFVGTPGARISDEEVAAADPEIIVLAWAAVRDRSKPETAYGNKQWRDSSAVRNRQVFVVRDELLNTPAPILTKGAAALSKILSSGKGPGM